MEFQYIYKQIDARYSEVAESHDTHYSETVAKAFGYSAEDLAKAPEGSNVGVSCGNPLALASLREGETVLDLGSGAGFDAFQAAHRVGATGKVIGVDMNKDMLNRASKIRTDRNIDNVDFVESRITSMPMIDAAIADCIISNCVLNLVPAAEKPLVFHEMFRLLKSGGRLAISDILAKQPLPERLRGDVAMYVGCIAGASMVTEYEAHLRDAGFQNILITNMDVDLNVYTQAKGHAGDAPTAESCCVPQAVDCCGGAPNHPIDAANCCQTGASLPDLKNIDLNEWVGSYKIYAVKA
ncbi:SAM-dependent methyltransferase UbiE/COQ5 family protein [Xylariales sp. PMI_506]|nr:SAM-dependent methyltransferase UbiE/COQ5 family protein [Xylariales sp. PMI_506]